MMTEPVGTRKARPGETTHCGPSSLEDMPRSVPVLDSLAIGQLRDDLAAAEYRVDVLAGLWGPMAADALRRENPVPARRAIAALPAPTPAGTLARLFLLAEAVPAVEVQLAVPNVGLDGLVTLGLVEVSAEAAQEDPEAELVRAIADLRPYAFEDERGGGHWWIASDLGERAVGGALPEDHVLGVGGASATLASITLQLPAERILDLGTGCGIQALHASRWAREVVATDISERALAYARFNAALNGVSNINFRLGSLFEPVAGERFDRIVTNPPFVITPRGEGVPEYEYRDGGMEGDALTAAVVAGAAEHLTVGGIAQLLGNWEYRVGDEDPLNADGLLRAANWATGARLEYWIVERERLDPAEYAETWIRDGGSRPGDLDYDRLLAAWLTDFEHRGVTDVGFGMLLLRRPEAGIGTLARSERIAHATPGGGLAAAFLDGLRGHDALSAHTDAELNALRLRVAPDVTEERHHMPGEEHPSVLLLRQGGGFGRTRLTGTAEAALVGACDGDLTLGVILDALAELLEESPKAMRQRLLPAVRDLVVEGFLQVVSTAEAQE